MRTFVALICCGAAVALFYDPTVGFAIPKLNTLLIGLPSIGILGLLIVTAINDGSIRKT